MTLDLTQQMAIHLDLLELMQESDQLASRIDTVLCAIQGSTISPTSKTDIESLLSSEHLHHLITNASLYVPQDLRIPPVLSLEELFQNPTTSINNGLIELTFLIPLVPLESTRLFRIISFHIRKKDRFYWLQLGADTDSSGRRILRVALSSECRRLGRNHICSNPKWINSARISCLETLWNNNTIIESCRFTQSSVADV